MEIASKLSSVSSISSGLSSLHHHPTETQYVLHAIFNFLDQHLEKEMWAINFNSNVFNLLYPNANHVNMILIRKTVKDIWPPPPAMSSKSGMYFIFTALIPLDQPHLRYNLRCYAVLWDSVYTLWYPGLKHCDWAWVELGNTLQSIPLHLGEGNGNTL